ncbi:MAG: hypothetical protein CVV44_23280 [Spirochaetae bacterium HGW-Spirochaetae-1]|jgi:stage II sporulation protein D|nr:MAG: hypothetical protein CVV44_23280 [Spirochaetae bacterium HGW-Spirochaetae-1]
MKKFYFIDIFALCIVTLIFSCTPSQQYLKKKGHSVAEDSEYIRVLLLKSHDMITISSKARMRITDLKDNRIVYDASRGIVKITPDKIKSRVLIESWNSPLSIQNTAYRGSIEITNVLGNLHVINLIRMEDYIKSVVPSEIPSSWPMEALKAQAVAARTYAYYHLSNKSNEKGIYDLDATTNFQVYKGISVETESTSEAVMKTNGEVIVDNYKPIVAYFHSACGGRTVDDKYVWIGNDLPYLKSVRCPFCSNSPNAMWEIFITIDEIKQHLSVKYKSMGAIKNIAFYKKDGRVVEVRVKSNSGTINLNGNEFRLLFPTKMIKSLYFTSIKQGNGLKIKGHGWGHGVGLCQWGAKGQAENGASYKKILNYYYHDTKIAKLNGKGKDRYASR